MTTDKQDRVERGEERPEPKERPKQDYKKPELTKFGPVEEFTGTDITS